MDIEYDIYENGKNVVRKNRDDVLLIVFSVFKLIVLAEMRRAGFHAAWALR